jgi:transposase
MDSDELYEQRKAAIHLLRSGLSKSQVAARLNRSLAWVSMCWNRYSHNKDFTDLRHRSRAPRHIPSKLSEEIRREIIIARSELEAEAAEGGHKVSIGAKAVQARLRTKGCKKLPCTRSIERILQEAGMSRWHRTEHEPAEAHPPKTKTQAEGDRNQPGRARQDSKWILNLLQGQIGFAELNESLAGKLDPVEIRKLLYYVLSRPLRYRNRASIVLAYLHGVPKTKSLRLSW